jgi:hypothetical protein
MKIPVFVSAPSPNNLNPRQEESAKMILELLRRNEFEWRALGRSDYARDFPLREVLGMVRHCSGGIILGFEQFHVTAGEIKRGSPQSGKIEQSMKFPTPWNQIEAGILFSVRLPLMIFREPGVKGGVFDLGSTEVWIHDIPTRANSARAAGDLSLVFQNWAAKVRQHYYGE